MQQKRKRRLFRGLAKGQSQNPSSILVGPIEKRLDVSREAIIFSPLPVQFCIIVEVMIFMNGRKYGKYGGPRLRL